MIFEDKKELNYLINHDTFNLLSQQFLEGTIDRKQLFKSLGIKKEDFYGILGENAQDHLLRAVCRDGQTTMEQVFISHLEGHIRGNGRFHDDPEPPKILTPKQKREQLIQEMEIALKAKDMEKFDALSLELAKEYEKEMERLREAASRKSSRERVY